MAALFDYPATDKHPAHTMQMRVNFVDGSEDGESLRLIGSEGCIVLGWSNVKVIRNKINKNPGFGGWDTFNTFTEAQQRYEKWYRANYPEPKAEGEVEPDLEYKAPQNYSANLDHHLNFYAGIREGKAIKEDALFGMRAGGPALLANKSYFEKKVIHWDPEGRGCPRSFDKCTSAVIDIQKLVTDYCMSTSQAPFICRWGLGISCSLS